MNTSGEYNESLLNFNYHKFEDMSYYVSLLKIILYYFYWAVCIVGIPGNLFILTVLSCILMKMPAKQKHMYIYLLSLCMSDLLDLFGITTIFIKPYVLDSYWKCWFLCKFRAFCETFGKIISSWYLILLSFDRYVAICHITWNKIRSVKFALSSIFVLFLTCSFTLGPQIYNANLVPYSKNYGKNTTSHGRCKMFASKAQFWNKIIYLTVAVGGFIVPVLFMMFFYSCVVWKLVHHSHHMKHTRIPVKRITCFTIMLVIFFLLCWTPFWLLKTLKAFDLLGRFSYNQGYGQYWMSYVILIRLPHIYSALNWILYSLLNKELRHNAGEFIEVPVPWAKI